MDEARRIANNIAKLPDLLSSAPKKQPPTPAPSESAAEREKRWAKHLQAIDKDRYRGEEPRDLRREDMRRGIV